MFAQAEPSADDCHWYANVIGCVPSHTPGSAVSVSPSAAVPAIDGAAVIAGAAKNGSSSVTSSTSKLSLDFARCSWIASTSVSPLRTAAYWSEGNGCHALADVTHSEFEPFVREPASSVTIRQ